MSNSTSTFLSYPARYPRTSSIVTAFFKGFFPCAFLPSSSQARPRATQCLQNAASAPTGQVQEDSSSPSSSQRLTLSARVPVPLPLSSPRTRQGDRPDPWRSSPRHARRSARQPSGAERFGPGFCRSPISCVPSRLLPSALRLSLLGIFRTVRTLLPAASAILHAFFDPGGQRDVQPAADLFEDHAVSAMEATRSGGRKRTGVPLHIASPLAPGATSAARLGR